MSLICTSGFVVASTILFIKHKLINWNTINSPINEVNTNLENNNNNWQLKSGLQRCNVQIILDWDDSLFPTEFTLKKLDRHLRINYNLISPNEWNELCILRNYVYNLLLFYITYFGSNNICIITNAKLDWFNSSCNIYNKLYQPVMWLINNFNIMVRTRDQHLGNKSKAMYNILQQNIKSINNFTKVICIGDGIGEYNAINTAVSKLRSRSKYRDNISFHRIKLQEEPLLKEMIYELQYIKDSIDYNQITNEQIDKSFKFYMTELQ